MAKFLICKTCGNQVEVIDEKSGVITCCGNKMSELIAGTTDASVEKHVPVYSVSGYDVLVNVGSVTHPMEEEHYIEWIEVVTDYGVHRKNLKPNTKPQAEFRLVANEKVLEVYAYCNLHSLWKA